MTERGKFPLRIFWIDAPGIGGRIAVMPRPLPGHFGELRRAGVDCVVSLMQAHEARRYGLGDEAGLCRAEAMDFLSLPVVDHGIPETVAPVEAASAEIRRRLAVGQGVAVHCYAGLGRSPLLIAATLIDCGWTTDDACDAISRARGSIVPEMEEQHAWLYAYEARRKAG